MISKALQGQLEKEARRLNGWAVVYNDDIGMIVTRDARIISAVKAERAQAESGDGSDTQDDNSSNEELLRGQESTEPDTTVDVSS